MMDAVREIIIRMDVDNIRFECSILPTGEYVILGPVWGTGKPPVLVQGRLGFGYAFTGLQKSLAELIRLKLKS